MRKIGISEFSKDGFLLLGGGGFIDIPSKKLYNFRVGGLGTGFSQTREVTDTNNQKRTVNYEYGMGGMSFEYVRHFGRRVDLTLGLLLSTGKLTIELFQSNNGFGNWNSIFNELNGSSSTNNFSHVLSTRYYSLQPQIGIGIFLTGALYAKLDGGYQFSTTKEWEVDNGIPVSNVPTGIKADGFNINFSINFGLFSK